MNRKKKFVLLAMSLCVFALLIFPILTVFIMLLGILFIPPALLFASFFIAGIPIVAKELGAIFESGKEMFILSVSKESIVLEPNINR